MLLPYGSIVIWAVFVLTVYSGSSPSSSWIDSNGRKVNDSNVKIPVSTELYAKAGSLIDLETEQLNFDLDHPVDITV